MPAMTRRVIEQLPGLRAIGCCRTEPVNINVAAATAAGIPVFYAPGRNARAVAEFTVGLIIAEYRDIARGHQALSQGIWRAELYLYDTAPHELYGQTVGLIGFGNIGRMMPGLLKPFGMRVLAYDPYVPDEVFAERGAERVYDMDDLLAGSDIVSLHARVTPETRGFIGERQFRRMKRGAYFINTARGPMVDYDALYRALADGHLAGAGLETFAHGAAAARLAPAQAAQRDPHAAHRRLLAGVGHRRGRDGVGGYRPLVRGATAAALRKPGSAGEVTMTRNLLLGIDAGTTGLKAVLCRPRWHDPGASLPGVPDRLSAPQLGAAGSGCVVARGLRRRAQGAGGGRGRPARHRRHRRQRPGAGRRAGGSGRRAASPRADLAGPPLRAAVRVAARTGGRGGHHPDQRRARSIRITWRPSGCG